jgi:histone H3/H4
LAAKGPSTGGKTIQAANGVIKKKRKVNRSKQMFKQLQVAQRETHLIVGKAHAERLLKKCLVDLMASDMRMSKIFREDFRWALEAYFVEKLEKMQTVAIHGGRVVVKKKDNILVRYMAGELDSRSVKKVAIV